MLREGENVVVIDARSEAAMLRNTFPSAINFPHRKMNRRINTASRSRQHCMSRIAMDWLQCIDQGSIEVGGVGFQVKELIGESIGGSAMDTPSERVS